MGNGNSKVDCIWLPGQSGKTRNMMERIQTLEDVAAEEYACDGFLNIVISANNRALVDQTEVRMNKELYRDDEEDEEADSKIEGTCFKWHSGLKNNNITVGDLADRIKDQGIGEREISMIVCCAHPKRLEYLAKLLTNLENSRIFSKKINIWIDEADASVKLWSRPALDVTRFSKVNKVILVSATYDSILKKYGNIRVLPCIETTLSIYHSVQDCIIVEQDIAAGNAADYMKSIFLSFKEELAKPGVCLFAPGDIERASHDAIAEFLYSHGFAIVVINGIRKEILIPGYKEPISLTHYVDVETGAPEEVGKIIAKIYHDNKLFQHPFAITGHLCLGRGITFQNNRFLFTHGVMFDISDKANAYQTACRLAGNIKGFPAYSPSKLFTTSKMVSIIIHKENAAINIGKHVAENGLTHVDKEMIERLYGRGKTTSDKEKDWDLYAQEFTNRDEANDYLEKYGCRRNNINQKNMVNGFQKSSTSKKLSILSYDNVVSEISGWSKLTGFDIKETTKQAGRLITCYKNLADASTIVHIVRVVIRRAPTPRITLKPTPLQSSDNK